LCFLSLPPIIAVDLSSRYNSPMRTSHRVLILSFTILIIVLSWSAFALAQSTTSGQPADTTGQPDASAENPEGAQLPADIPTRENFLPATTEPQNLGVDAWTYVKFFFALALVLGIIYGLSLIMKKVLITKGLAGSAECLKVLYTQSLGPNKNLYLVRLVDRVLLLGSTENGLSTLSEITDPEEVSSILKELEFKGNFDLNPFRDKLKSLVSAGNDETITTEDFELRQRKMNGTLDRLKNIGSPKVK
jgi:flagellar biosynthetic protein FliO